MLLPFLFLLFVGCEAPQQGQDAVARPAREHRPLFAPPAQQARHTTPSPQEVAAMRDPNVVGVATFYDPINPWLWNENKSRPRGLIVQALYLKGSGSKGVFGDGVIRPKMYVLEPAEDGERQWKLVREWAFDVEGAMPFRARKEAMLGWGYGLVPLAWEGLDLGGREIRVIVEFERIDGHTVSSGKKDFRVPRTERN